MSIYTNVEGGRHIRFVSVCVHVVYRVYLCKLRHHIFCKHNIHSNSAYGSCTVQISVNQHSEHITQHNGHTGHFFQNELMVEIYSKSLLRAIGKVLLMKLS